MCVTSANKVFLKKKKINQHKGTLSYDLCQSNPQKLKSKKFIRNGEQLVGAQIWFSKDHNLRIKKL